MDFKSLAHFFKRTYEEFQKDHPDLLAAGLGYFALFSLAPLMVLATAAIGHFWTKPLVQDQILSHLSDIIGGDAAESVGDFLQSSASSGKGKASILSLIILYLAASRIFAQLRAALDIIWDTWPEPENFFRSFFKTTLKNFAMMMGVAIFAFAFFVMDAALAITVRYIGRYIPGVGHLPLLQITNGIVSFVLFMGLFTTAYKYVPDTPVAWSDVIPGSFLTAALFTVGKFAIGLYLQLQSFDTVYGAAGSVIVVLVWIYFAAQIFFFGAEFCWLYAQTYGSRRTRL